MGRVGIGDRAQDLALAGDSIREELGEVWMHRFFAEYGVALDENLGRIRTSGSRLGPLATSPPFFWYQRGWFSW
ncbi:MAG: hypothetical protein IPL28_11350 [Chloroflexi bacterium]|nr:hypothetical protein [Chloroflexota bacterium]